MNNLGELQDPWWAMIPESWLCFDGQLEQIAFAFSVAITLDQKVESGPGRESTHCRET
jgi:hypothetical protein